MAALLEGQRVVMSFGGLTAVHDVSFQVQPGEIFGLIEIGRASCRERV